MKNNHIRFAAILLLVFLVVNNYAQQKKSVPYQHKKPVTSQTAKKTSNSKQNQTQPAKPVITEFTAEQIEAFRTQSSALVKFFEGTLNFLADKKNPVKEKEIIINDSYLKFFLDNKVQIEDDLDEKRLVPLYKDIQAYLSDVDFFFKGATFLYTVQDISVMKNEIGQTYFKVTANRNLKAVTLNNDSVNSNKVRYFEINYDDSKQELKIASIYTTKMNEKEDMRNWWNALTPDWKLIFAGSRKIDTNIPLAQVSSFNDTVGIVNGSPVPFDAGKFYSHMLQIIMMKEIDISGNTTLTNLNPISKLSALKKVIIANTPVSDLMPLRNLNQLEELDISGTKVSSLDPLRYSNHLRSLKLNKTPIKFLDVLSGLTGLEILNFSNTSIDSLQPLSDLIALKDLRFSDTRVSNLHPLSGLINLEVLYFIHTPVESLEPLKNMKLLTMAFFDSTSVSLLDVFENIKGIKKIYCNNTKIDPDHALQFMLKHPDVDIVFESTALAKWWTNLQPEWKKVFNLYRKLDNIPSSEQLHHLITIDSLDISGRMAITSLDPVSILTRLSVLLCPNTSVNSLDPLKDLHELTQINANNTKITSVQSLAKLTKLAVLSIDHTAVNDISPLNTLKKLTFFYADNTGVTLFRANEFMEQNPQCQLISQTYENKQWWDGLSKAWQDEILRYFNYTGTPDKIQLQKIAGTDKLIIKDDPDIISLEPFVFLSRLKELEVSDTRVSSLGPLSRMIQLEKLSVPKNPIIELNPITPLVNLRELDFSNTQVEDLMPIQNFRSLEALKFGGTPVRNLKYLQNLRNLKVLEFYNTKISNLDVLETMTSLKSLKIFNTKISEKRVTKFKMTHPGCEVVFY